MATILPVREFIEGPTIVMATRRGLVKKTDLMKFGRPRSGGLIALSLEEGDELVAVGLAEPDQEILIGTRQGQIIRFLAAEVRDMGRGARGVKGIDVAKDDAVVGMEVISFDGTILTVTERGFGKLTEPAKYPRHHRGGRGVKGLSITKRNGPVLTVMQLLPDDEIMLVTSRGKILRMAVSGVRVVGRVTQGVKLMDAEADEKVVSVARVVEKGDDGEDEPGLL